MRINADAFFAAGHFVGYDTLDHRVQSIIAALFDIESRMDFGASLTNKNVAWDGMLSTKYFYAEALRLAISAVSCRTGSLLMCHFN